MINILDARRKTPVILADHRQEYGSDGIVQNSGKVLWGSHFGHLVSISQNVTGCAVLLDAVCSCGGHWSNHVDSNIVPGGFGDAELKMLALQAEYVGK